MYEPYPGQASMPPVQRLPQPSSVSRAVKLMYAGAALEVVSLIISLTTTTSLKAALLKINPSYTTAQLHTAEDARTLVAVVGAVITIGLWLWMAYANGRGRQWARVVSAVFFGINTLSLLVSLIQVRVVADLIIGLVIWLVGLGALVLIFNKESSPFFRQPTA